MALFSLVLSCLSAFVLSPGALSVPAAEGAQDDPGGLGVFLFSGQCGFEFFIRAPGFELEALFDRGQFDGLPRGQPTEVDRERQHELPVAPTSVRASPP